MPAARVPPGSGSPKLPPGSWDAHVHIFEPSRFPFKPDRSYNPQPAPLSSLIESPHAQQKNILIVQASIESSPEGLATHLREAKSQYPDRTLRGTMAADPDEETSAWHLSKLSEGYFRDLHDAGVRNIRVHGSYGGSGDQLEWVLGQFRTAAESYGGISVQLPIGMWARMAPHVDALVQRGGGGGGDGPGCGGGPRGGKNKKKKVVLMADHNGSATPKGVGTSDYAAFLELLASGKLTVKIGALHRRVEGGDIAAMEPVVKDYARVAPGGIVRGSDWPHVNTTHKGSEPGPPLSGVDTAAELGLIKEWLAKEQWDGMMVHNPARLLGW
ncbi:uncharacterized protein B0I36DRAFT_378317 [Microdochium trichocladiopsis]|uniref:Amidohydrolase-related domain-containing protein n=1 Tax=Microdochium trichocladiopsis TaxID=1682393 RepID=A0A9P9BL89_9PEZI|nr:uncharacterized protein B0I36DRAFT_378317 [Microdochium trichocladiopsis]KAH7012549.1 hypothetical protein B0I36DRAFT_378317 [Microdochium trichocladiopsis]